MNAEKENKLPDTSVEDVFAAAMVDEDVRGRSLWIDAWHRLLKNRAAVVSGVIMLIMLLGNIGIATVVATVIVSLLSTASSENWLRNVLLFVGCLSLLWIIAVSHFVERNLNRIIAMGLKKWTRLEIQDYVAILHLQNEFAVWEMKVEANN